MEVVKNRHLGSIVPSLGIGFEQMIRRGRSQPLTPRIIAGAFEAFIGALYLDAGFDRTREIVLALVGGEIEAFSPDRNYKKILQETVQKQYRILPVYRCVEREGSDHLPLFTYEVLVDGKRVGLGSGASIALATQDAACDGLKNLGRLPGTL
jgi:ribonuclease-3